MPLTVFCFKLKQKTKWIKPNKTTQKKADHSLSPDQLCERCRQCWLLHQRHSKLQLCALCEMTELYVGLYTEYKSQYIHSICLGYLKAEEKLRNPSRSLLRDIFHCFLLDFHESVEQYFVVGCFFCCFAFLFGFLYSNTWRIRQSRNISLMQIISYKISQLLKKSSNHQAIVIIMLQDYLIS